MRFSHLKMSALIVMMSVGLSACRSSTPTTSSSATSDTTSSTVKTGDTIKTGTRTEINGKFYLQEVGGSPKEIDSYAVDLKPYVNQKITVTGQYSGDTLFVGKVQ